MLNSKIELRAGGVDGAGKGLFATARIRPGEWIWRKDPGEREYRLEEIRLWPERRREIFFRNAYQTGPNTYHGPLGGTLDPADYMNHGCDPNVWFDSDDGMIARRVIRPDEEILYDYATSEGSQDYLLECRCGSPLCRGTVRGDDLRANPNLRERYGAHVLSYLRREVQPV